MDAGTIREWHDLYAVTGGASATLVGLLFVAVTVGQGVYDDIKRPGLNAFLTPTVVHFSSVLAASLVVLSPWHGAAACGALLAAIGGVGIAYAALVVRRMVRHGLLAVVDAEDRICYAVLPACAYALMAAGGVAMAEGAEAGLPVLSGGMALLLFVGIRNAWDMTVWTVVRRNAAALETAARQVPEP